MLKNMVELLCSLFLSALTLLISSSIVGSIVAALRAVGRGSILGYEDVKKLRFRSRNNLLG
jgi:hypothetical protein